MSGLTNFPGVGRLCLGAAAVSQVLPAGDGAPQPFQCVFLAIALTLFSETVSFLKLALSLSVVL